MNAWEQGEYRKSLYLGPQVCSEPKTVLNSKSLFLKKKKLRDNKR